jgi:hypothetical protein
MALIVDDLQVENGITGAAFSTAIQSEITTQKGSTNGIASLDGGGKVPSAQLPSFVDDVLEFASLAAFPVSGETGKIYIALDTNLAYRWSGSIYVLISTGAVASVFSRTGNVVAQSGDYTPAQVGADAAGSAANAIAFSIQRSNHTGSQASATISDFEASVLSTDLLGLVTTPTEIDVVAADTVIQAFSKLQGQNNLWTETKQLTQLTNTSNVTLTNINNLAFSVIAGKSYSIESMILFRSAATATGLVLTAALSGGAVGTLALQASIPSGGDGTGSLFCGNITASGDVVVSTATPTANLDFVATIQGIFVCTTSGTITPQFRSEINGSQITVQIGSNILVREF